MGDIYFNKNAGSPKKPVRRSDGYNEYEDISSYSADYFEDEYEDISSNSVPVSSVSQKRNPSSRPNHNTRQNRQNKQNSKIGSGKTKSPIAKAFTVTLIVVLIAVGAVMAIGLGLIGKLDYVPSEQNSNPYISEDALYSSSDVTNILLLGVDAREGETQSRSDTMMLISVDRANKKIKLTSFLRDSYVEIPGSGWNKLNAACTKGGVQLVMNTIEYNYKIKIDNYMLVDFKTFEMLIDSVGGVDVEITEKEANYLNKTWSKWSLTGNPLSFESGDSVSLNGEQALMFCRIRKLDSDFMRTDRQRRTVSALKEKITSASPFEMIDMANNVLPLIQTDINQGYMMKLALGAVFSYLRYDTAQQSIPADGTWHSERKSCGDSLVFDIAKNTSILKDFIYFDIYEGNGNNDDNT